MFLIKQMKKYRKNISIINQEECASIHIHTHSMESLDPDRPQRETVGRIFAYVHHLMQIGLGIFEEFG